MNPPSLKVSDYAAAAVPAAASETASAFARLSLAEWEIITRIGSTLFGALLGGAYLVWKWRREARKSTNHPFARD
jgi:hypothetical protein